MSPAENLSANRDKADRILAILKEMPHYLSESPAIVNPLHTFVICELSALCKQMEGRSHADVAELFSPLRDAYAAFAEQALRPGAAQ